MKAEIFESLAACVHLKDEWNALAREISDDISLTFEWHQALAASQPIASNLQVVWLYEGGVLQAILPICRTRRHIRLIPLQHLIPLGALYCAHDCLLIRSTSLQSLQAALDDLSSVIGTWDVFSFGVSDATTLYSALASLHQDKSTLVEWVEGKASPYLSLSGTIDDLNSRLGKNMRKNIRTRLKRMQDAGTLELRTITSPADVSGALQMVQTIELQSWKQRAGTSITANPFQLKFYETLMQSLAASGQLLAYFLFLNGKPIAHALGFTYKNRFFAGKTSFVDEARELQPGFVLKWLLMKDLLQRGVEEHDFMGDSEPHKMHWTRTVRRHRDVLLYQRTPLAFASRLLGQLARIRKTHRAKVRDGADLA